MRIHTGKVIASLAAAAALGLGAAGIAAGSNGSVNGSRLDDGKQYLSQVKIPESQAIAAAKQAAVGRLNEVDLETYAGRLCWNVDVGPKNVKVDAETGEVLDADHAN